MGQDIYDFMNYLDENVFGDNNSTFWETNESILSEETKNAIGAAEYYPGDDDDNPKIYDSRDYFSNICFELGKTDKTYTKNGYFETIASNSED